MLRCVCGGQGVCTLTLEGVKGLSTEVIDPSGAVVTGSFEHHGYVQNLCETLA
jgi:hypothetical protein